MTQKPLKKKKAVKGTLATKKRATGQISGKKGHKKPKLNRIKTLKRKLWETFSQFIRKSHADHAGYVTTCDTGEREHWKDTDLGHLLANTERSRRLGGNELWYYEHNFAPQSRMGNRFNANDSGKNYMLWAIHKYGVEEVEVMRQRKQIPKKWTEEELTEKYEYYKLKLAEL